MKKITKLLIILIMLVIVSSCLPTIVFAETVFEGGKCTNIAPNATYKGNAGDSECWLNNNTPPFTDSTKQFNDSFQPFPSTLDELLEKWKSYHSGKLNNTVIHKDYTNSPNDNGENVEMAVKSATGNWPIQGTTYIYFKLESESSISEVNVYCNTRTGGSPNRGFPTTVAVYVSDSETYDDNNLLNTEVTSDPKTQEGETPKAKVYMCSNFEEPKKGKYVILKLIPTAPYTVISLSEVEIYASHTLTEVEEKEATCLETGNIHYWLCSVCGKKFADKTCTEELTDVTTPLGNHNLTVVRGIPSTCTQHGTLTHYHCSVCDKNFADAAGTVELTDLTAPLEPHTLTEVPAVPATCTTPGTQHHWHCSVCGKNFSDPEGKTEMNNLVAPPDGSLWDDPVYVWADDMSSCSATRTCSVDGTQKETVETKNITREQTKAPTCTENGETTYTASFAEAWAGNVWLAVNDVPMLQISQKETSTTTETTQPIVDNPQTLDNIMKYVTTLILSSIGTIAGAIYLKKRK